MRRQAEQFSSAKEIRAPTWRASSCKAETLFINSCIVAVSAEAFKDCCPSVTHSFPWFYANFRYINPEGLGSLYTVPIHLHLRVCIHMLWARKYLVGEGGELGQHCRLHLNDAASDRSLSCGGGEKWLYLGQHF